MSAKITSILLKHSDAEAMKKVAASAFPNEGCALLSGTYIDDTAIVDKVKVVANVDKSPVSFRIDPNELLQAYLEAEREGKEIVGIYHSHPAPPRPSGLDLEYMKINTCVWIIHSTINQTMEAFQYRQGKVVPVSIKVKE
jgi:proteasome lid subunit RPN8/RPN11